MSQDSRKTIIPFIVIGYSIFLYLIVISGMLNPSEESTEIVPLTGLPMQLHNFLVVFMWPLAMSIVTVIIFPRVFIPLFLKFKQLIWKDYENGFVEFEPRIMTWRTFLRRMFFGFLLVMCLEASLAPFIDPFLFFTVSQELEFAELGLAESPELVRYVMAYFGVLAMLIVPFAVGLWSIGWGLLLGLCINWLVLLVVLSPYTIKLIGATIKSEGGQ